MANVATIRIFKKNVTLTFHNSKEGTLWVFNLDKIAQHSLKLIQDLKANGYDLNHVHIGYPSNPNIYDVDYSIGFYDFNKKQWIGMGANEDVFTKSQISTIKKWLDKLL